MRMNIALVSVALVAALGIGTAVAGVGGGGGAGGAAFDGNLTGNLDVSGTVKAGTGDAFTVAADGAIVGKSLDVTTPLPDSEVSDTLTCSDLVAGSAVVADSEVVDALTISGGTVDNSVIGGSTPAAGTFTALTATGTLTVNGSVTLGDTTNGSDSVTVNGYTRFVPTTFSTSLCDAANEVGRLVFHNDGANHISACACEQTGASTYAFKALSSTGVCP